MKKEKKAIVKNSEYYYRKSKNLYLKYGVFVAAPLCIISSLSAVYFTSQAYNKKMDNLRESVGYHEIIEERLNELDNLYKKKEISKDYLVESQNKILVNEFKQYLKDTNNEYKLTEFENIQKLAPENTYLQFMGCGLGTFALFSITSLAIEEKLQKKALKLKKQEMQNVLLSTNNEISLKYSTEYVDNYEI